MGSLFVFVRCMVGLVAGRDGADTLFVELCGVRAEVVWIG